MTRALWTVLFVVLPLPAAAQSVAGAPALEPSFDAPAEGSAAAERACAEGRVRTGGLCCWPGQFFSEERGRCAGAPLCPLGLVEHGESCVEPAFTTLPTPGAAGPASDEVPSGYTPGADAGTTDWLTLDDLDARPTAISEPFVGEDEAHIIASFIVFDVANVLGWLIPMIDESTNPCRDSATGAPRSCNSWWFAFLPVAGGMLSGVTSFGSWRINPGFGFGLGIPSLLFQTAGLIALAISFANHTDERRAAPMELEVTPSAPDSDIGGGFRLRF